MCMLNHCLEWDKWVLMNFDHNRQWFNTLISPSNETAAVTVDCISRLSGLMRLALHYTTVDIHCRDRQYQWDGGISKSICWLCRKYHRKSVQCGSCSLAWEHSGLTWVVTLWLWTVSVSQSCGQTLFWDLMVLICATFWWTRRRTLSTILSTRLLALLPYRSALTFYCWEKWRI